MLSFLADQDAGQRGLFVDFFGRPASTHKAIALLAIEHQAPVVVGYARRIGPGFRYEVGCELIEPEEWTGTRRRPAAHPALHDGPREHHPPRPRAVPLAASPLEAPAESEEESRMTEETPTEKARGPHAASSLGTEGPLVVDLPDPLTLAA